MGWGKDAKCWVKLLGLNFVWYILLRRQQGSRLSLESRDKVQIRESSEYKRVRLEI